MPLIGNFFRFCSVSLNSLFVVFSFSFGLFLVAYTASVLVELGYPNNSLIWKSHKIYCFQFQPTLFVVPITIPCFLVFIHGERFFWFDFSFWFWLWWSHFDESRWLHVIEVFNFDHKNWRNSFLFFGNIPCLRRMNEYYTSPQSFRLLN